MRWRIALDSLIANYDELTKAITINNKFDKPACFLRASRSDYVEAADLALIRALFPSAELRTIAMPAIGYLSKCRMNFFAS